MFTGGALILWLLQGGQAWPWLSVSRGLALLALATLLFALTILAERRAAEPIMPGWLWRRRVLVTTNVAMIGMGLVMMGTEHLPAGVRSIGAGVGSHRRVDSCWPR